MEQHVSAFVRLVRGAAIAVLAAAALACSDTTSPLGSDVRFVLDAEPDVPYAGLSGSTANAAGGPGVVVAIGRIVFAESCYTVAPRVQRSGQTLDLAVVATLSVDSCSTPATAHTYSLRVAALSPGTYHVRLLHELRGLTSLTELVLEQDVRVD